MGRRTACLAALIGLLALQPLVASCASTDEDPPVPSDDGGSSQIPETEAGVDASDAGCPGDVCTAPEVPSCDDFEWCLAQTPQPVGIGLASVWGSGPKDVWAVGAFGSVIHWDGAAWASVPVNDSRWSLRVVWGSGPNDVWTMSATNMIFHSTGFSGGTATWTPVTETAPIEGDRPALAGAMWGTSADDVWIGGLAQYVSRPDDLYHELVWRSSNGEGGLGWSRALHDWTFDEVKSIWGSSANDVWIVGRTMDNLPFAVHTDGSLDDKGVPTWVARDTQSLSKLNAVWGSGPNDVWAVGDHGTIRHMTADAAVLTVVDSPTSEHLLGLWGSGPNDVWAVGQNGTLLHYDGNEWRTATGAFQPGNKPHLYSVWGSGPNDVWAVGSGVVMHYTGPKPASGGAH